MSDFMKSLSKIAIPVTLQSMLQASFSIIDQIMIGQLGEVNIAAVGLYGNFSLVFSVVIGSVGTVAGILIAQFTGADNEREAWCSLNVSLLCGALLSVLFLLAAGGFPAQILQLYTADGRIQQAGTVYFKTVALAYLPMALSTVLSAWLRCKEHAAIPFWASLGAVAANTGLNFLLILLGFVVCLRRDGSHPLWTLHFERITLRAYGGMILPILLSEFLWSLGQNVESAVYGHLGTANLAAYTLTCPIQSLIVGALSGLSAAAGVMVGKHLGKKTYDAAYGDARRIMLTGLVGAIGVASLLVLFAGAYTNLYRVDADVQTLGKALLVVFALYAPVKVENMILSGGILRSGGNTRVIMIIDTIGTWGIGIPLCLLAAFGLHWGIVGVYALLTTEEIFRLAVSLVIFKKRSWMISL